MGLHRGWAIAFACLASYAVIGGGVLFSFGQFVEPLEDQFGWSRTQINLSLSLIGLGSLAAPFIGRLIDKYGSRSVMTISLLAFGVSHIVRPLMTNVWHWYGLSLIQSAATVGGAMLPPGKLIGLWFPTNRGKALAVTVMGNNFGGITVQPLIAFIILKFSWGTAYFTMGVLALFIAAYSVAIISNPRENKSLGNGDSSNGDLESNDSSSTIDEIGITLKEALRTRSFYGILVGVCCGTFTYSALLPYVSSDLLDAGTDAEMVSIAVGLFAAGGIPGKFLFGLLSDKIGARYPLLIDLLCQALFAFLLVFTDGGIKIWFVVPMMGFFLSAFGTLYQLIVLESFGTRHFGAIFGVISMSSAFSFIVGPILAGKGFDLTGGYEVAFATTAAIFLVGAGAVTQVKKPDEIFR